eukprot:CAMPEP_0174234652 /NCGR_PEP_ID=MMETSP0417-20130205/4347_1 /TAXON_ID=242541 /ORGANISM="Mayorella sp, Strain BSH-02190019" /LENGTH=1081 /DNA_ID=CAMNT_0015313045 /DNA_START=462 /DNA_END=3704 /DNA_ORIENTATION=-
MSSLDQEIPEKVLSAAAVLRAGNLKKIKQVKLSPDEVNLPLDVRGTRLLHIAAEKADTKLAEHILSLKANPNVVNDAGRTPLHIAARNGFLSLVDLLLQADASGSIADHSGITPLHSLCSTALRVSEEKLFRRIVQTLLERDESLLSAVTHSGDSCLHFVCYGADDVTVAELLVSLGSPVNVLNERGQPPLAIAATKGAEAVCLILLEAGADITQEVLKSAQHQPNILSLCHSKKYTVQRERGHARKKQSERAQKDINSALKEWIGDGTAKVKPRRVKTPNRERRQRVNSASSSRPGSRIELRSSIEHQSSDSFESLSGFKSEAELLASLENPIVSIVDLTNVIVPSSLELSMDGASLTMSASCSQVDPLPSAASLNDSHSHSPGEISSLSESRSSPDSSVAHKIPTHNFRKAAAKENEAIIAESRRRAKLRQNSTVTSLDGIAAQKERAKKVKTITLRAQDLTSLPSYLFEFDRLRTLHLDHNELNTLPVELASLERLETVSLSHNKIQTLTHSLAALQRLAVLDLSYNRIEDFAPLELHACLSLEELSLSHNRLTTLPDSVCAPNFSSLFLLNLEHNNISRISAQVGTLLQLSLQELRVEGNPLMEMPENVRTISSDKFLEYLASKSTLLLAMPATVKRAADMGMDDDEGLITPRQRMRKVHVSNSRERVTRTDLLSLVHATSSTVAVSSTTEEDTPGAVVVTPPLASSADTEKPTWSIMINQLPPRSWRAEENLALFDNSAYADYEKYFFPYAHVNLVGRSRKGEPIVVSILKESYLGRYRALIRTHIQDSRAYIPEELVGGPSLARSTRYARTRNLLKGLQCIHPIDSDLREINFGSLTNEYLDLEERTTTSCYKFGLLHCPDAGLSEEQIFSSQGSPEFWRFCDLLGEKVVLQSWDRYSGGLDTKNGSTGVHSYFATLDQLEIMFHVSCLLPFQEEDAQRLERKRHIGNDIVCLVFLEGEKPFDPNCIASKFIHIYVVVRPLKQKTSDLPLYQIQVVQKDTLRPVSPWLPQAGVFEGDAFFVRFLLTKMINAERSAMMAPSFSRLLQRTRSILLEQFFDSLVKMPEGKSVFKALRS